MRRVWAAAGVVGLLAVGGCKASTIAGPSDPPTTGGGSSTAAPAAIRAELRGLKVAAEGSMRGYTREKFSIWARESDHCTARQDVLKRDGKKVVEQANGCQPKSGSWYSAYDGKTVTAVAQATIDHVVPLAEAWRSGADHWSPSQRKAFGNDLKDPQLVIASQRSNSSKGRLGSGGVEADRPRRLVHLRHGLRGGQAPLEAHHHDGGAVRAHQHARHLPVDPRGAVPARTL